MIGSGGDRGVFLLEVILAISIFSIAIMGLAIALDRAIDTVILEDRQLALRQEMISRLAEVRKDVLKVGKTRLSDDSSGVLFWKVVKPVNITTEGKKPLRDLYQLSIVAQYSEKDEEKEEELTVYLYEPKKA